MTTTKPSSTKIQITLNESNYVFWEFAMTDMLRDHGLLEYVLSNDELEVEGLSEADPSSRDYAKKKAKAASAISKNLGQEQIALILQHRGDPSAAWKALRNEYAGSSNQDVTTMIMEINKLRLNDCPSEEEAKSHFSKMTLLANKLRLRNPDGSMIELKNVAYVPDASANLFSVNAALIQLEKAGDKEAEFKEKTRSGKLVNGNGNVIVTCSKRGGLKYLDLHSDQDF